MPSRRPAENAPTEALDREVCIHEVRELVKRVVDLNEASRIDEADQTAKRAHGLASQHLRPTDREYVLAFNRLAMIRHLRGDEEEAVHLLVQVLPFAREALGASDTEYVALLNNLAVGYQRTGRPADAVPLMQQVIDAKRQRYGEGDPSYLPNLQDLILALEELDRVADTEPYVREMARIVAHVVGEASPEYVAAAHNLVRACHAVGKDDEARTLAARVRHLTDDPDVQQDNARDDRDREADTALRRQVQGAYEADDFETAARLHRELLATLPSLPLPSIVTDTMGNMLDPMRAYADDLRRRAVAEDEAGRHVEAAAKFRRLVELVRVSFGPDHMYMAVAYNSLGLALARAGDFDAAKQTYAQALELFGRSDKSFEWRDRLLQNIANLFMMICDQRAPDPGRNVEAFAAAMGKRPEDYARFPPYSVPAPEGGGRTCRQRGTMGGRPRQGL